MKVAIVLLVCALCAGCATAQMAICDNKAPATVTVGVAYLYYLTVAAVRAVPRPGAAVSWLVTSDPGPAPPALLPHRA